MEDVWERAATGLALERAQRQRRAPGWQAGYVDPLKPLSAQHQQADSAPYGNTAGGTHEAGHEADSARLRKRGAMEELLQGSRKLRCSSAGPAGVQHGTAQHASRLGAGVAKGTPTAGCSSEPARVPPNGFWAAPPKQPTYTAPVGPELLSWVLMVPPAAAALARPAWAGVAGPAAAATAPGGAALAAAATDKDVAAAHQTPDSRGQQGVEQTPAPEAAAAAADGMVVDAPAQKQPPEQGDTDMTDAAPAADTPTEGPAPAVDSAAPDSSTPALTVAHPAADPAAATVPAAAAVQAPAAAGAQPCLECIAQGSAMEVRIVLDGCVFVGQLKEVSRLEMARSRVGAAVEPIKQV